MVVKQLLLLLYYYYYHQYWCFIVYFRLMTVGGRTTMTSSSVLSCRCLRNKGSWPDSLSSTCWWNVGRARASVDCTRPARLFARNALDTNVRLSPEHSDAGKFSSAQRWWHIKLSYLGGWLNSNMIFVKAITVVLQRAGISNFVRSKFVYF